MANKKKKEKHNYESIQNASSSVINDSNNTVVNEDDNSELSEELSSEEQEDVNKLFLFYPNGIDKTEQDKIYKLTDADLNMHISFSEDSKDVTDIMGQLRTTYFFEDTNIGDLRTWRYKFYDVVIKNIHLDSSSEFIVYDIEAGGFDVNQ